MTTKHYFIIGFLLLVFVIILLLLQPAGTQDESGVLGTEVLLDEPRIMTIPLGVQNNSGESGTATLTDVNGNTKVVLKLTGAPENIAQPAHIHEGTCASIGAVKYPLTFPVNGESETLLEVSLDQLFAELPLAINVHKSEKEAKVFVSCGGLR